MKIILLEKVEKLGSLGDQVEVKNGYARNYLLPTGKALRATEENIKHFEEKASDIKKKNDKDVKEANKFLDKINGKTISSLCALEALEHAAKFMTTISNKNNFKIPKNVKPETITQEVAEKIISEAPVKKTKKSKKS